MLRTHGHVPSNWSERGGSNLRKEGCIDKKLFAPNPLQTYKVPDKAFPYYLEIFSASHTIWQYYLAILSSHIIFLILSGNIIWQYYLPILSFSYHMAHIILPILYGNIIWHYYLPILPDHNIWLYYLPIFSFPYYLATSSSLIIFPILSFPYYLAMLSSHIIFIILCLS